MSQSPAEPKALHERIHGVLREITACFKILALYPANHPARAPALERAARSVRGLVAEHGGVRLGVSEESLLLLSGPSHEQKTPVGGEELARRLHALGVLTLEFAADPPDHEIAALVEILAEGRDEPEARLRGEEALRQAGWRGIGLTFVDYRRILEQAAPRDRGSSDADFWTTLAGRIEQGDRGAVEELRRSLRHDETRRALAGSLAGGRTPDEAARLLSFIYGPGTVGVGETEREALTRDLLDLLGSASAGDAEAGGRGPAVARALEECPGEVLLQILASALVRDKKLDNRVDAVFRQVFSDPERRAAVARVAQGDAGAGLSAEALAAVKRFILEGSEEPYMSREYHGVLEDLHRFHLESLRETLDWEFLSRVQEAFRPETLARERSDLFWEVLCLETRWEFLERQMGQVHERLAAWAREPDPAAIRRSMERLLADRGPDVAERLRGALFRGGPGSWLDELLAQIGGMSREDVREVEAILAPAPPSVARLLVERLGEERSLSGRKRLSSLLLALGREAVPFLVEGLDDARWYLVRNLVMLLGKIGDASAVPYLIPMLGHPHFRVRKEVLFTLSLIGGDRAVPQIRRVLLNRSRKEDPRLQTAAAAALKRIGTDRARRALKQGMADADKKVQEICCQVLKGLV